MVTNPMVPPTCWAKGGSSGTWASPSSPEFLMMSIALSGSGVAARERTVNDQSLQLLDDAVAGDLDGAVVARAVAEAHEILAEFSALGGLTEAERPCGVEVGADCVGGGGERESSTWSWMMRSPRAVRMTHTRRSG